MTTSATLEALELFGAMIGAGILLAGIVVLAVLLLGKE